MCRSEMNETSMVTMSKRRRSSGRSAGVSARALTRSMASTRGSLRICQSSWPCPTSRATTRTAPRCSRTSVNPPVEAPMSRPRAGEGDREHVERVGEFQSAAARHTDDPAEAKVTSASAATAVPALRRDLSVRPERRPARINARARSRAAPGRARREACRARDLATSRTDALMPQRGDRRELPVWRPARARAARARCRGTRRPAGGMHRDRRARDKSACRPPRPYRRSCRVRPIHPRHRGYRRRSETRDRPARVFVDRACTGCGQRRPSTDPRQGSRADERAGLARMHAAAIPSRRAQSRPASAGLQIDRLPADHADRARRLARSG